MIDRSNHGTTSPPSGSPPPGGSPPSDPPPLHIPPQRVPPLDNPPRVVTPDLDHGSSSEDEESDTPDTSGCGIGSGNLFDDQPLTAHLGSLKETLAAIEEI